LDITVSSDKSDRLVKPQVIKDFDYDLFLESEKLLTPYFQGFVVEE
jgi:hypothetical protein